MKESEREQEAKCIETKRGLARAIEGESRRIGAATVFFVYAGRWRCCLLSFAASGPRTCEHDPRGKGEESRPFDTRAAGSPSADSQPLCWRSRSTMELVCMELVCTECRWNRFALNVVLLAGSPTAGHSPYVKVQDDDVTDLQQFHLHRIDSS